VNLCISNSVCGGGFFCCVENSQTSAFPVGRNLGNPFFAARNPAHTFYAGLAVLICSSVKPILLIGSFSKVCPTIVGPIAVDVINVF